MSAISPIDTLWVLIGTILVFFMQAGFTMVETGFTRSKNAGNIIMKNVMDFVLGSLIFWIFGFSLIFGESTSGFIGSIDLFTRNDYSSNITSNSFLMFQIVFCATAATIVSGAVAERTKFTSYLLISAFLSAVVYPISAHWIWGGGFLSQMGFVDFAGSTAVHMVGGVSAIIFAKFLGPRIGKYRKDGTPRAITGHSLTLAALGIFILWFGWFGFNGGSQLAIGTPEDAIAVSDIFLTTNLSAVSATIVALVITWYKYKKPDISMTLNGVLAGLVGITAGCASVTPVGALIIGAISGFVIVFAIEFVEQKLKIDDPVGAFSVHGVCGALGTILVGLFATEGGLFYGGGADLLITQIIGVLIVILWVSITVGLFAFILKKSVGIRVSEQEELAGLDIEEHGVSSYADFVKTGSSHRKEASKEHMEDNMKNAVIVHDTRDKTEDDADFNKNVFTKIRIVTNNEKLDQLRAALKEIGINGIMVYQVLGHGVQHGQPEYYRGAKLESHLLPKVCVEMVVCKVPVDTVVTTAIGALKTGTIGDGKIFISNIENVVRVRTGEEGFDALQDYV